MNRLRYQTRWTYGIVIRVVILCLITTQPRVLADNRLKRVERLAEAERYGEAIGELGRFYWKLEKSHDKIRAEFLLAVCYCRSPDENSDKGLRLLDLIPRTYRHLPNPIRYIIKDSRKECMTGRYRNDIPDRVMAFTGGKRVVSGKGGPEHITIESAFQVTDEELGSRRFPVKRYWFGKARRKRAIRKLQEVAGPGFSVFPSKHFFVVGRPDNVDLQSRSRELEKLLGIICAQYSMNNPKHMTTVYMIPTVRDFVEFAYRVHGITMPAVWGYTFSYDSSMVIAVENGLGTQGHEVFHTLLNENFPYAPPWLNEGVSALYEEYYYSGDGQRIYGSFRKDHWRIPHLTESYNPVSLGKLIWMDWHELDGGGNKETMHRNHAVAKMFAMYLQDEKNALREVVDAFRHKDFLTGEGDLRSAYESTLSNALGGISIEMLDKDFRSWLVSRLN